MSQQNVEIVRRLSEAVNREDFEAWLDLADSQIELWDRADDPGASTEGANLFEVHDGKVTRLVTYWHRDLAFADLGLSE